MPTSDSDLTPGDVERLFARGKLSRSQFVQALAALGVTVSGLEALFGQGTIPVAAQSAPAQYLVVIVMDAFRADYVGLQPMPTLTALAHGGTSYDRAWVGQLESETPTSHASLSTGSMPKRTGILGFEWRDPSTKQKTLDGWPPGVLAGDLDRDLKASGTESIPSLVKAAFPQARAVTLSSEKVYAADAMGGPAADYILYHSHAGTRTKPMLVPNAVPGHAPSKAFFQHPNLQLHLPRTKFTDWDWLSTMLAIAAVEEYRPKVLMVNLPGGDVYGHPYGGPATPSVMKQVIAGLDRNIARILDAYKKAGIYEQTLFVVTGDHGMVPNNRGIGSKTIEKVIQEAGGEHLFHWGGTGADIWLKNWWHAKAVAAAMGKVQGVSSAYYQVNDNGQYHYVLAPGVSIDPGLDAANQYLLSTFAGPRAPDVVVPFRENTVGEIYPTAHGEHGGLDWGSQHIPLVLSGPGVKSGLLSEYPARLIDIAPTVLRLMGINPTGMDGVFLADAMANATAADLAAQSALEAPLSAYQNSLMTQSAENLAEDKKLGFHPPQSQPARP